jgi:hypothetical protein
MSNLGGTPPPASTISPAAVAVDTHTTRTDVLNVAGARILCVADIRGAVLSHIFQLPLTIIVLDVVLVWDEALAS